MARARFTPEVIAELRARVIAHNEAGGQRVRLEELKKAYAKGHRGPRGHHAALGAVDKLLLRKSDQPRDSQGRFASTGAGQRAAYSDVATREQDRALREENAGYAASQIGVIPETRFSTFLPAAGVALAAGEGAIRGAFPAKSWRRSKNWVGRVVAAPLMLGPRGSRETYRKIIRGLDAVDQVQDAVLLAPSRAILRRGDKAANAAAAGQPLNRTTAKIPPPDLSSMSPGQRRMVMRAMQRAKLPYRAMAATAGAAVAVPTAGLFYAGAGNFLGPYIDAAIGGRRIEKMLKTAPPGPAREMLAKAGGFQALMSRAAGVAQRMGSAFAAKPALAGEALRAANRQASIRRVGIGTGAKVAGLAAGAAGGAALAGGAVAGVQALRGKRVYERDEDGRFTFKGQGVPAAMAAGAIAGAVLAGRGINKVTRRKVAALMRTYATDKPVETTVMNRGAKVEAAVQRRLGRDAVRAEGARLGAVPKDDAGRTSWNNAVDAATRKGQPEREALAREVNKQWQARLQARPAVGGRLDAEEVVVATRALDRRVAGAPYRSALKAAEEAATKALEPRVAAASQGYAEWGRLQLRQKAQEHFKATLSEKVDRTKGFWATADDALGARMSAVKTEAMRLIFPKAGGFNPSAGVAYLRAQGATTQADALQAAITAGRQASQEFEQRVGLIQGGVKKLRDTADRYAKTAKKAKDALDNAAEGADTTKLQAIYDKAKTKAEDAAKEAAKAEAIVDPRGAGLATAENIRALFGEEAGSALPIPRNPFARGTNVELLEAMPTKEKLAEELKAEVEKRIAAVRTKVVGEALDAGEAWRKTRQADIDYAMSIINPPANIAGRVRDAITRVSGPPLRRFGRDTAELARETGAWANRQLSGYPKSALDAGVRGAKWSKENFDAKVWPWIKGHKGLLLGIPAATGLGGAVGIDYGSDGSINLDTNRARRAIENPSEAARETLRDAGKKGGVHFRVLNPMSGDQAIITGVTAKTKDGKRIFVSGTVEIGMGGSTRTESIPAGASVEDVEARYRKNQGGNQQQGGGRAAGNPEVLNAAREAGNKVWNNNAAKGTGDYGDVGKVTWLRDAEKLDKDDRQKVADAAGRLKGSLNDVINKGNKSAESAYGVLQTLFGKEGHVFKAGEKADLAIRALGGSADQLRQKAGDSPSALAGAMSDLMRNAPAPRDDNDVRLARLASRFLGDGHLKSNLKMSDFDDVDELIKGRRGQSKPAEQGATKAQGNVAPNQSARAGAAKLDFNDQKNWGLDDFREGVRQKLNELIDKAVEDAPSGNVRPGSALDRAMKLGGRLSENDAAYEMITPIFDRYYEQDKAQRPDAGEFAWRRRAADMTVRELGGEDLGLWKEPDEKKAREGFRYQRSVGFGKAAHSTLRKEAPMPGSGQRRPFDETKIKRSPRGDDRGGEFAPKAGAKAAASGGAGAGAERGARGKPPQQEDDRSVFEPVRLAGAAGGVVGGQAVWEIMNRYMPKAATMGGKTRNFALTMLGSVMGGAAGQMAGERLGAATYTMRGKEAPAPFEEPEREAGEEVARTVGAVLGSFAGMRVKGLGGAIAVGSAGQLAGEELMGRAYQVARDRFGLFGGARG